MLHGCYGMSMCVCKRQFGNVTDKEHEVCDWKGKKATTEEAQGLYNSDKCLEEDEEWFSCFDELLCTTGSPTDVILQRKWGLPPLCTVCYQSALQTSVLLQHSSHAVHSDHCLFIFFKDIKTQEWFPRFFSSFWTTDNVIHLSQVWPLLRLLFFLFSFWFRF